uniref:RNase H type-1 domain-containing protein n=1 Tax=Quercus lobata TaxID=97700 RepID=A0A7N2N391_QUELO
MLHDYRDAQSHLSVPLPSSSVQQLERWKPPTGLNYKVNIDATIFPRQKASGFGVVIRNERGETMAAVSARGPLVQNSKEAEALACRKAVEVAMDLGFRDVTLEGDNISVMSSISSTSINRARLGFVYDDIRCMGRGFRTFHVNHVRRTANTVAHSLADAGLIEGEMVWLEQDPPPARDALYSDSCHISL